MSGLIALMRRSAASAADSDARRQRRDGIYAGGATEPMAYKTRSLVAQKASVAKRREEKAQALLANCEHKKAIGTVWNNVVGTRVREHVDPSTLMMKPVQYQDGRAWALKHILQNSFTRGASGDMQPSGGIFDNLDSTGHQVNCAILCGACALDWQKSHVEGDVFFNIIYLNISLYGCLICCLN